MQDALIALAQRIAERDTVSIPQPINGRIAFVVSHAPSYAGNGYAIRTQGIARALTEADLEVIGLVRPGRPWSLAPDAAVPVEQRVDGVRYIHSRHPADRDSDPAAFPDGRSAFEQGVSGEMLLVGTH